MEFAVKNKDKILQMYEDGYSSYEMAEKLDTYSTKILRCLEFLGGLIHNDKLFFKRSYSEAQKIALQKGRSKHPTEGKVLERKHKEKIGKSRSMAYANLSDQDKEKVSQSSKKSWNALGKAKQGEIRTLALEAVRNAGKFGSKTEVFLKQNLTRLGYTVEFHKTNLVPNSKLEVDLFLPEIKTAIEIDGPGHFLPIWGEEKLIKQQTADFAKQGILIDKGYLVLRIRQVDKHISLTRINNLTQLVLQEIEKIRDKFPDKNNRLIEIEVKNGESRRI
jgi:very-short-patch-repair endonuclease